MFDSIQLRASLNASLTLLSIWLFVRLRGSPGRGSAFTTGLCLAGSYLLRPTGLILMGAAPLVLLLEKATRSQWKTWAPALGLAFVVVIGTVRRPQSARRCAAAGVFHTRPRDGNPGE